MYVEAIPGGTSFPGGGPASLTIRSKNGNRLELVAKEYGRATSLYEVV
jgi:hypothetical protein